MPLQKGWRHLNSDARSALLKMYDQETDSEELVRLCKEQYGVRIKAQTLTRRLREWRQLKGEKVDKRERVSTSGDVNSLLLQSVSSRITTVPELLEHAEVDLEIWEVSHFIVNTYESFRKAIEKNLSFSEGVIDGYVEDHGGVNIVPLYQVKVWLKRIEPIKLRPVVEPITFEGISFPNRISSRGSGDIRRAVVLPDPQFGFRREDLVSMKVQPFHDRAALDVALQIVEDVNPDDEIWLGDILDLPDTSLRFARDPLFTNLMQITLIETGWWLSQFRGVGDSDRRKAIIEGNHEDRIPRLIVANMLAMYDVKPISFGGKRFDVVELVPEPAISVSNYLALGELGYEYLGGYPKNFLKLNDGIKATHGKIARKGSTVSARAMLENSSESVAFGHIHRIELASKTLHEVSGPRTITAFSSGCLCHIDGRVPGDNLSQWQQGLGVIEYEVNGSYFNPIPILINNGRAIYDGKVYEARDRINDLRENTNTGWEF